MVHHYMEEITKDDIEHLPSVDAVVLPHPDMPKKVAIDDTPVVISNPPDPDPPAEAKQCCIDLTGDECPFPPFPFSLPSPVVPQAAMLDVRDLPITLLGTFAMGATVAFVLMYFSRRRVVTDA